MAGVAIRSLDNHNYLARLTWRHRGRARTTGRGIFFVDDCLPNCGEGTYHTHPIKLIASRIRRCAVTVVTPEGSEERVVRVNNGLVARSGEPGSDLPYTPTFTKACSTA